MEGDRMKMREALLIVKRLFDSRIMFQPAIRKAHKAVDAALAAPPRQCDIGTAEEQGNRFNKFCKTEKCRRYRCRSGCKATCIDRCAIAWAQMPYEAAEGGAK